MELIVVIAILGVLSAILVPTMMGVVAKARVTKSNSAALNVQRNINLMLMQSDPRYYGIVGGKAMILYITVKSDHGKSVWTCSAAQAGTYTEDNIGGFTWGRGGTYTSDQPQTNAKAGEARICASLCESTGIKKGSMVIVLYSGSCSYVVFTDDTDELIPESEYPAPVDGKPPVSFTWNGKTAGISPSGMIIGTAPPITF